MSVSSPESIPSLATAMNITLTSYPKGKHTLPHRQHLSVSEFSAAGGKAVSPLNVTLTLILAKEFISPPR